MHVLVCGAGVIGACTAYFLTQKGARVTVLEKTAPACAASGKAGGFLARGWSSGALGQLSNASFDLHERLADELGGEDRYGYRRVTTFSLDLKEWSPGHDANTKPGPELPDRAMRGQPGWVDRKVRTVAKIGSPEDTAQVHPKLFTDTMLAEAAKRAGPENFSVKIADVRDVRLSPDGQRVVGVVAVSAAGVEEVVQGDRVVIAMGPWSSRNPVLKELPSITGLKAHSIVVRPPAAEMIGADMLFLQVSDV